MLNTGQHLKPFLDNGNFSIFVKNPITKQTNIKQNKTDYKTHRECTLTFFSRIYEIGLLFSVEDRSSKSVLLDFIFGWYIRILALTLLKYINKHLINQQTSIPLFKTSKHSNDIENTMNSKKDVYSKHKKRNL